MEGRVVSGKPAGDNSHGYRVKREIRADGTATTELEAEQSRLQSVLAERAEPPALRLHPSLSTRYRELIDDLARSLNAPDVKREAAEALRGLISEVCMVPDPTARNGHAIELIGELAGILRLGGLDATKPPRFARAVPETMVAGGRNQRSLRNGSWNAKTSAAGALEVSQVSLVAGACNQRYLRLVERQIPKLAA